MSNSTLNIHFHGGETITSETYGTAGVLQLSSNPEINIFFHRVDAIDTIISNLQSLKAQLMNDYLDKNRPHALSNDDDVPF